MGGKRAGNRGGARRCLSPLALLATLLVAGAAKAAELTPQGAPRVVAKAAILSNPVGPVSDDFRRRIEEAAAAIPEIVRRSLREAGWQVQVAEFVVDAAPSLTGEQPRGWPTGLTWANTDAVNLPHRRLVVVAEKRRNREGEVVVADRIEGVFRHELGHAFDRAGGGQFGLQSAHPDFVAAYIRDIHALPVERRDGLEYYLQGEAAGRQEAYAEAFAIVLGGGSDPTQRDAFIQAFPRVMTHLKNSLAEPANSLAGALSKSAATR